MGMIQMAAKIKYERWRALVNDLEQLKDCFPLMSTGAEKARLEKTNLKNEVRELTQLPAIAEESGDEHSQCALAYLQAELARKLARLEGF